MGEGIPKRIIQIWGGEREMPLLGRAAAANMRLLNPDFEYLLFDDERMQGFVDEHFPDYRNVFDSFSRPIHRYDFFRYLAVYELGGFYFDTDVFLASSVFELLEHGCVFPFERLTWSDYLRYQYGMDWEIGNYAFGAIAGHPFLGAIIDNCVRAQKDKKWRDAVTNPLPRLLRQDLEVIYSTGPGMVSRTFAECPHASRWVTVLFPENVCDRASWDLFGAYGVHLGAGGWRKRPGNIKRRLINLLGKWNEERAIRYAHLIGRTRSVDRVRIQSATVPPTCQ